MAFNTSQFQTWAFNGNQFGNFMSGGVTSPTNQKRQEDDTYNPRYPWFNKENYEKLERKVSELWLTWSKKQEVMDEFYRQILPQVENEKKRSQRNEVINQKSYQVSQIKDESERKIAKHNLSVEELAQMVKEKENLREDAPDAAVFNAWIRSIPNWDKLLADYMNNGNRELLYAWGLAQKLEAPETPEPTVWWMQSIINKQSETSSDTFLWKTNNVLDKFNVIGNITEWLDNLVQKIPTFTYEKQVENLANKINNLSEDDMQNLYDRYTRMIKNWSDKKRANDDRGYLELFWDAVVKWDQDATDRLNTLQLYDYSQVVEWWWVERNKRWNQLWDKVSNWASLEDINQAIDDKWMNKAVSGLAKASVWTADKTKNLLNFVGWAYGSLQNYAEALGAWLQSLDDIRDKRYAPTEWLENDADAFTAFVADQTANFGEYMTDAPDTLLGKPVDPNVIKFFSNIPWSFLKTLSAQVRWKTNPLDTKVWLVKMLFTEEWQQAIFDRYGTPEAFANSINTDPVWVADDLIDMADKFNLVLNKASWGNVSRQNIWSYVDALSNDIVNGGTIWKSRERWEDGEYLKDENGNYVTKDINIAWINQWLTNVSNWLDNKWWRKTWWLVDIARDTSLNPWRLTQDVVDETKMVVEDVSKIPADIQAWARERADKKIQNINRMNKTKQEKFVEMSWGEDQWTFQNKRNLKTTQDMADHLTENLKQVDDAMDTIEWRFTSPQLDVVMEDVLKYATDTEDPNLSRMQELSRKNAEGWLEMKEINEVKRYYERTNIFDYLKEWKSKKARKSTNRDSALREWQYEIAEKSWLDNLKDLNQETRLTKFLLDNATDWQNGVKGNNDITLTDWIVASWWWLDASWIAALVGKKVYQSNRFQEKLVDVYNLIWNRQYEAWPTVDIEKIKQKNKERAELAALDKIALAEELAKVETKKQFDEWLQKAEYMAWPALPQYDTQNYNTIMWSDRNPITVTPWWQSVRQWQIAEL